MKKIISLMLSFVMALTLTVPAFAAENTTINTNGVIISENAGIRTATYTDETTTYTVIYNTVNNSIQVSQTDLKTEITSYGNVVSITDIEVPISTRSTIHQDTFCDFEYDIYTGNPNEWNLERPSDTGSGQVYFKVYENSSNEDELDEWFKAVNALNDKEWEAVAACSLSIVMSCAAGFISGMAVATDGFLTPGAITSITAAVGATGTALVLLNQVGTCCNVCRKEYQNVLNATDNMHR